MSRRKKNLPNLYNQVKQLRVIEPNSSQRNRVVGFTSLGSLTTYDGAEKKHGSVGWDEVELVHTSLGSIVFPESGHTSELSEVVKNYKGQLMDYLSSSDEINTDSTILNAYLALHGSHLNSDSTIENYGRKVQENVMRKGALWGAHNIYHFDYEALFTPLRGDK